MRGARFRPVGVKRCKTGCRPLQPVESVPPVGDFLSIVWHESRDPRPVAWAMGVDGNTACATSGGCPRQQTDIYSGMPDHRCPVGAP